MPAFFPFTRVIKPTVHVFLSFLHELHALDILQVRVLSPDNGMMNSGGCHDHRISHRQFYFMADLCGCYGDSAVKVLALINI